MTPVYADEFMGSTPLPEGRDVMPLADFPAAKREAIWEAVQEPTPPPKWLRLGLAEIVSRAWYEWHWYRGIDPDGVRPKLSPSLRQRIINRDGFVCGICEGEVDPTDVHVDHIVPWSRGGSDRPSNLRVTHSICNLRKGAKV